MTLWYERVHEKVVSSQTMKVHALLTKRALVPIVYWYTNQKRATTIFPLLSAQSFERENAVTF